MMRVSIVDQSPVHDGESAADALRHTLDLVVLAESLGYHRYWFAQHHGSAAFASASPEVLMAAAAQVTSGIRIGSGGFLLGEYPPLRLAEIARTLEAVTPGRIDIGLGRAPGGDGRVVRALQSQMQDAETRLDEFLAFVNDDRVPTRAGEVVAVPDGVTRPEIWMLGTSPGSGVMAGRRGLPYAFGSFIDPTHIQEALTMYHTEFVPGEFGSGTNSSKPRTMLAVVAICGRTDEEANQLARASEQWFVESFIKGNDVRFPSADTVRAIEAPFAPYVAMRRATTFVGSAERVADELAAVRQRYAVDELAVVTITHDAASRMVSYERLAEALSLTSRVTT